VRRSNLHLPLLALIASAAPVAASIITFASMGGSGVDYLEGVAEFPVDGSLALGGVYTEDYRAPAGGPLVPLPGGAGGAHVLAWRPGAAAPDWVFRVTSADSTVQGFGVMPMGPNRLLVRGFAKGAITLAPVAAGVTSTFVTDMNRLEPGIRTNDGFLAMLDASGTCLWYDVLGGSLSNFTTRVAAAPDGDFYVLGTTRGEIILNRGLPSQVRLPPTGLAVDSFDVWMARYSAEGIVQWARHSIGAGDDTAGGLAVLPGGDFVATGRFQGTETFNAGQPDARTIGPAAGDWDVWVGRWDSAGRIVWLRGMGGPGSDVGTAAAALADGDVLVAAGIGDNATLEAAFGAPITLRVLGTHDIMLARLDGATGRAKWARTLNTPGDADLPYALVVDMTGRRVWLGGVYTGRMTLGATGPAVAPFTANSEAFVAGFNVSDGRLVAVYTVAGPGTNVIYDLAMLSGGRLAAVGSYSDRATATVGTATRQLVAAGGADSFVLVVNAPTSPLPGAWLAY
jgi:hypothetical protein